MGGLGSGRCGGYKENGVCATCGDAVVSCKYCSPCRKKRSHNQTVQRRNTFKMTDPKGYLLYIARASAKRKGTAFTITTDDLPPIPEFCPVLPWIRLEYKVGTGAGGMSRNYTAPTIDRIDNAVGYVPGNVRIISQRANVLKSNGTDKELEKIGMDAQLRLAELGSH